MYKKITKELLLRFLWACQQKMYNIYLVLILQNKTIVQTETKIGRNKCTILMKWNKFIKCMFKHGKDIIKETYKLIQKAEILVGATTELCLCSWFSFIV